MEAIRAFECVGGFLRPITYFIFSPFVEKLSETSGPFAGQEVADTVADYWIFDDNINEFIKRNGQTAPSNEPRLAFAIDKLLEY